jgi:hypothetical protein
LKELVTLGPNALPLLLAALDDQTPTKLTIGHDGGFDAMWFSNELPLNPVNRFEQAIYREGAGKTLTEDQTSSCTIRIGDVCFVAVGQIVGRSYSAVRYQPSSCIVLNSPAHDAGGS